MPGLRTLLAIGCYVLDAASGWVEQPVEIAALWDQLLHYKRHDHHGNAGHESQDAQRASDDHEGD